MAGQIRRVKLGAPLFLLTNVFNLLLLPLAILTLLIVRLLRPLVLIRFGYLDSTRIGQFVTNPEIYLCALDLGLYRNKRTYDIFYHLFPICNFQIKKMWDRILNVSSFTRLVCILYRLNPYLPGYKEHIIPIKNDSRDILGLYGKVPAHLTFTDREELLGQKELRKIGIEQGTDFVCFHVRDSAYLEAVNQNNDWHYHNYRDASLRNYLPAAEALAGRGYFLFRMGAIVKEPLNSDNPVIIDYATKHRTDFLDIYLSAKCKFFIGSGSGIDEVPAVFRRPVVYVNFIPLEQIHTWSPVILTIPKKLFLRKEKRFLSFREIMDSGIGRFLKSEQYERLGIDIIENTAEEITAAVLEMDERIKGTWKTTDEDEELQRRFWSPFKSGELRLDITSRVGAEFLRQNRALLN